MRPDIAWWERPSGFAVVLGEFERAETLRPKKLVKKAENLLRAHNALENRPRLLLLVGWALAVTNLGDPGVVRAVMASGFRTSEGTPIRVIRHPYFGRLGTVTGLPDHLEVLESESKARIFNVEFNSGEKAIVPRANVEMIEG